MQSDEVVSSTLGVIPRAGQVPREALLAYLRQRQLLLVVDNCEHLVDAAAEFVDALLSSCPGVHVLATTREALGVVAEHLLSVSTLSPPAEGEESGDALRLLLDRAEQAHPDLSLTPSSRAALVDVCRRVD